MGTHLDGEYVRFYKSGAASDVLMSTLFYSELNIQRPLRGNDLFYLQVLAWSHSAVFTGNVHAGAGAVQTGEYVWVFDNDQQGNVYFHSPIPIVVPVLKTSAGVVWGHGFIRSA